MVIQRASRILRDGVSAGPRAVGADQGPCRHLTHLTYALTWNFRALSGGVRIRAPPASPRDSALMPRHDAASLAPGVLPSLPSYGRFWRIEEHRQQPTVV
jgi:hypothetical protein